jgi:hypothetical protein
VHLDLLKKPAAVAVQIDRKRVKTAGFRTTVLPASRDGSTFVNDSKDGRFHGLIAATTPSGT